MKQLHSAYSRSKVRIMLPSRDVSKIEKTRMDGLIVEFVKKNEIKIVILSQNNTKAPRNYDKKLYKMRYLIENFALEIKK